MPLDEKEGSSTVAKVWKNGKVLYELTDDSKDVYARSVYVVGEDVYVAGNEGKAAKVWKNGEELYELTDKGEVFSIVVYNGNVYVAGKENEGSYHTAKVWKNGEELYELADKSEAYSIFIAETEYRY